MRSTVSTLLIGSFGYGLRDGRGSWDARHYGWSPSKKIGLCEGPIVAHVIYLLEGRKATSGRLEIEGFGVTGKAAPDRVRSASLRRLTEWESAPIYSGVRLANSRSMSSNASGESPTSFRRPTMSPTLFSSSTCSVTNHCRRTWVA